MLEGLLLEGVGVVDLWDLHTINTSASLPNCISCSHGVKLLKCCNSITTDTTNGMRCTVTSSYGLPGHQLCEGHVCSLLAMGTFSNYLSAGADCISAGTCVSHNKKDPGQESTYREPLQSL